ncbi:putative Zn-binding protein involved in type VI secretion [Ectopseudomonas oleovorans]|uniref:Putative Zn-binding protein involved in type VI secretion n=1 Tax=Ectopseudomonas oleovorans TaxID=301 RepID=A0A397MC13_ECTOL|nr:putative Zn-binding protein involved in type VI secretion [Pseudomonas oleovorans]
MSGKPAARQSDPTSCPIPGHGTNPVATGSPNVIFDGLPAARMADTTACGGSIVGAVSSTVFINGMPATTVGSTSNHGGVIVAGSGSVLIGDTVVPAIFNAPTALTSVASMMKVATTVVPASTSVSNLAAPTPSPPLPAAPADPLSTATTILENFKNRQTPDRIFNDPANPIGTPFDPFEKSKIIGQLQARLAKAHGQQPSSASRVSAYPNQQETSLCGPAAFFYALLMDRPDLYAQSITELWETGETAIGQLRIKPSHGCRNPTNLSRSAEGDRISAIDWISLASLRDSENSLFAYDSPSDQVAGITLPSKLKSWFSQAGAKVLFDNIQYRWHINRQQLLELMSHIKPNAHVTSLVSASMVEGGVGVGKNHWIVWEQVPQTSNGSISDTTKQGEAIIDSSLFSWGHVGNQVTRGYTVGQLESDLFGGLVFSRIP